MRGADRGQIQLVVPTIVLAEALWVSEKRNPGVTFDEIVSYIVGMPNSRLAGLSLRILQETRQLPQSLEHDRIIAATARA